MMEEEQIVINKIVNDAPDSIEIGTPSKGGATKVYGNFSKLEEFKTKIDNAAEVKAYAQAKLQINI
jgi:hypothetical protein